MRHVAPPSFARCAVLEIWGAEYQENDCLLIKPSARELLEGICARERCFMQVIGVIDGSGRVVLEDRAAPPGAPNPAVDLDLEKVLGDMPNKTFKCAQRLTHPHFTTCRLCPHPPASCCRCCCRFTRSPPAIAPLQLPAGVSVAQSLDAVLRLPSVCSKRFLTTKVDRSVTGLIAQQQCCGPLQLPISDVAVMAQTHFEHVGAATAIGEQPLKGLIDPRAMARLALGEALTNLVWARCTALRDIKVGPARARGGRRAGDCGACARAAAATGLCRGCNPLTPCAPARLPAHRRLSTGCTLPRWGQRARPCTTRRARCATR